jgi:hypothetical protein
MKSYYDGRPAQSFWKTGVCEQDLQNAHGLYRKKFAITPETRIATAGSCFAQHIGTHLKANGFNVLDKEQAPVLMLPKTAQKFGYGLYSARYGNVYTARQFNQLLREAYGQFEPSDVVWTKGDRYFDALRPGVEPEGLDSPEEVKAHRRDHLKHVKAAFDDADLVIFTFGLTETFIHRESGTVFPTAPGTIAGAYDADRYEFHNLTFSEVYADFVQTREMLKKSRPDLKFLVTVSPVPLTATATDRHVLPATIYSKSVLRAVAGQLSNEFEDVDYFPSYEIIATPFSRQLLYDANLRTVLPQGVEMVMRVFFREHGTHPVADKPAAGKLAQPRAQRSGQDVICEEMLLEAFAK